MKHKCFYCKTEIAPDDLLIQEINGTNRKFHKEESCCKKYLFSSETKCKHCRKKIMFDDDYEEIEGEYIHANCIDEYITKRKEMDDFDKVYKYVKYNLLKYKEGVNLSPSQVNRLKALRDGKINLKKGDKQQYNGYPFHIIYLTLLYKTKDIEKALATKVFDDEKGKVDYITVIVANSINDVYQKITSKEESDKRLVATVERLNEKENKKMEIEALDTDREEVTYIKNKLNRKIIEMLEQDTDEQIGI